MMERFYPIASHADDVACAVRFGARLVQIRLKSGDREYLYRDIKRALEICHQSGAHLVVNDHWEIALSLGASYLHLGQEDLRTADLAAIRHHGMRLGVSTHSHEELERALRVSPDYIALGPIWETTLKTMPWRPQGLDRIREWSRLIHPLPLVAIGGITHTRCRSCLEAGAQSVAVVSDIFRHPHPEKQMIAWQNAVKEGPYASL